MKHLITLTFELDEAVTPDFFAQRVAQACSSGALRPGEGVQLPSDPTKIFKVDDKPVDLSWLPKNPQRAAPDKCRYGDIDMSETTTIEGWTDFGGQARKFHYIPEDDAKALCGKWGLSPFVNGAREKARLQPDTGKPSPDDCVSCRRKLDKLNA